MSTGKGKQGVSRRGGRARGVAGAGGGSAGCDAIKFGLKIEGRAAVRTHTTGSQASRRQSERERRRRRVWRALACRGGFRKWIVAALVAGRNLVLE